MPTHNYNANGDVLDPNEPLVSAYTADAVTTGGAYGSDTAADHLYLVNKVNTMHAILVTKQVISAS